MAPACETCPFKAEGVFELKLPEDPVLASGSATLDGATVITVPDPNVPEGGEGEEGDGGTITYTMCPHNPFFMADPNAEAIIAQQAAEMQLAQQAAQAMLAQQAAEGLDSAAAAGH